jgi:hypothetical protein
MHACPLSKLPKVIESRLQFRMVFSRKPENLVHRAHRPPNSLVCKGQHSMRFRNDCKPPSTIWHSSTDGIELEVSPDHGEALGLCAMHGKQQVGRSIKTHTQTYRRRQIDAYKQRQIDSKDKCTSCAMIYRLASVSG